MCHFVSLDMPSARYVAPQLDMPCGARGGIYHIECECNEHISIFECNEKYIEFAIGEHIDKKRFEYEL